MAEAIGPTIAVAPSKGKGSSNAGRADAAARKFEMDRSGLGPELVANRR